MYSQSDPGGNARKSYEIARVNWLKPAELRAVNDQLVALEDLEQRAPWTPVEYRSCLIDLSRGNGRYIALQVQRCIACDDTDTTARVQTSPQVPRVKACGAIVRWSSPR